MYFSKMSPSIDLGRGHFGFDFSLFQVRIDEGPLEFPVNLVAGRVPVRVGSDPAVVLNGGVQRLSAVADVVPKPAGIKNGCRFYAVAYPWQSRANRDIRAGRP